MKTSYGFHLLMINGAVITWFPWSYFMSRVVRLGFVLPLALVASAANASILTVEYKGTVSSGSDAANDFSVLGGDLSGAAILVKYRYDTAIGSIRNGSDGSLYYGGSAFASMSPLLDATITINGQSVSLDGRVTGLLREESGASGTYQYHEADAADGSILYSSVSAAAGAMPASPFAPFSYVVSGADRAFGSFTLADGTTADFTPTSLVSTVPLPTALPMFSIGLLALGAAGAAGRRTKASTSAT